MELLKVITLEKAREDLSRILDQEERMTERAALSEAAGRELAEDVRAAWNVPSFRRSTVDGYAVIASDTHGSSDSIPVFLNVKGEVLMGENTPLVIGHGQCAYVPTGGMIPEGADAMVMVEYCEMLDDTMIAVGSPVGVGANIVMPGDDMKAGDIILEKGRIIGSREIGALAAAGYREISLYKKYTMTIISLGDELTNGDNYYPGDELANGAEADGNVGSKTGSDCLGPAELAPGMIYESNGPAIKALAEAAGIEVKRCLLVPDDTNLIRQTLKSAMEDSDFVVTSGGSSKGRADVTASVMEELCGGPESVYAHGIAIKPGKPTIMAYDKTGRTSFVGLPGHPAAAYIIFMLVVKWCVIDRKLPPPRPARARLKVNVPGAPGRMTVTPVKLSSAYAHPTESTTAGGFASTTASTTAGGFASTTASTTAGSAASTTAGGFASTTASTTAGSDASTDGNLPLAEPAYGTSGLWSILTEAEGYIVSGTNCEGLRAGEEVDVYPFR